MGHDQGVGGGTRTTLAEAHSTQVEALRKETRFDGMHHLAVYTSSLARKALEVLEGRKWEDI